MGAMSEWFLVIKAAKYLGVAPWVLEQQHPKWYYRALAAERAEIEGGQEATVTSSEGGEP